MTLDTDAPPVGDTGIAEAPAGWPDELGDAAFHGVIGDAVKRLAPETEADPVAILIQLLVMFGSVIGRGAHALVGRGVHWLNLFAVIVGKTAKSRKGMSLADARSVFESVDPYWLKHCQLPTLSSGEGLIWAVRDPTSAPVADPGVEDKRLLVTDSEFVTILTQKDRLGNTLSPNLRLAWDGRDLAVPTKNNSARATAPHISVIGHITESELRRHRRSIDPESGFGNRFLFVCARRRQLLHRGGNPVDLRDIQEFLHVAATIGRECKALDWDAEADAHWKGVYTRLAVERAGMVGAMAARAEAQITRLAWLYAVADLSLVVRRVHLEAALELWRYCEQSLVYLFESSVGHPIAEAIYTRLSAEFPAGVTRDQILKGVFNGNRRADEIDEALGLLERDKRARSAKDHSRPGRPPTYWFAISGHAERPISRGEPGTTGKKAVAAQEDRDGFAV